MTFVLPLHTLAVIVWLGGLFLLCVLFYPGAQRLESATALSLWHRILSRFFVWAWISMLLILASGIAMIFLAFGGFSGVPSIHRWNMLLGIPAIALFGYLYFVPWRHFRHAMSNHDRMVAEKSIRQARTIMVIILTLGLVASVVSVAGRYYIEPGLG
jgi:uncharacterized membrane protein